MDHPNCFTNQMKSARKEHPITALSIRQQQTNTNNNRTSMYSQNSKKTPIKQQLNIIHNKQRNISFKEKKQHNRHSAFKEQ